MDFFFEALNTDVARVSVCCVGRGFGVCGALIKTVFVSVICDI
jgi:hypothetical protein